VKALLLVLFFFITLQFCDAKTNEELFAKSFLRDAEWFISLIDSRKLSPDIERDVFLITYKRVFLIWFYNEKKIFTKINPNYIPYLIQRFRGFASSICEKHIINREDPLAIANAYDGDGTLGTKIQIKELSILEHLKNRKSYQNLVHVFFNDTKLFGNSDTM
jgi:hypothetical protein